jgi:hypothetical protein
MFWGKMLPLSSTLKAQTTGASKIVVPMYQTVASHLKAIFIIFTSVRTKGLKSHVAVVRENG